MTRTAVVLENSKEERKKPVRLLADSFSSSISFKTIPIIFAFYLVFFITRVRRVASLACLSVFLLSSNAGLIINSTLSFLSSIYITDDEGQCNCLVLLQIKVLDSI